MINPIAESETTIFSLNQDKEDPYRGIIAGIVIKLSDEEVIHERQIFNALDLIGEAGGLFEGLNYLAQFLLGIVGLLWNEPLYNYIISKVYTIDNQMDGEDAPR